MTDNDYIAEYIKEKRPEIITSFSFIVWKLGKIIKNTCENLAQTFNSMSEEELKEFMEEKENDRE